MDDFSDDIGPQPADVLAESSRMPRSLCAFVLKLNGWDLPASARTLERITAEIPGWSRLPQGVLWKQVQTLVGHARPSDAGLSVDVDLSDGVEEGEVSGEEPRTNDARLRGVRDAMAVLAKGRLELRAPRPLSEVPCACPACLTLSMHPPLEAPSLCATCGGPLLRTFSAGEEAGLDVAAYCDFFNARVLEHVRAHIDASFELDQLKDPEQATQIARPGTSSAASTVQAVPRAALESLFADPVPEDDAGLSLGAIQPDNELERAVLEAEDWRFPIAAVPFELDALLAVRKRAALDAERDLIARSPRRLSAGEPEAGPLRFDCPGCMQTWSSEANAPLSACPECGSGLVMHAWLGGEVDEATLAYAAAYGEAVLVGIRASCPGFGWHLLFEAPRSAHARLGGEVGLPVEVVALAWDVSAGDEHATRELLGWLAQRLGEHAAEGEVLIELAGAVLDEIGAEADPLEVEGRRRAEEHLRRAELVRHAPDAGAVCPACLKRWPAEDDPAESCILCGGPLIHEQPLGDQTDDGERAVLAALNARMDRQIRATLAPGFERAQVEPG